MEQIQEKQQTKELDLSNSILSRSPFPGNHIIADNGLLNSLYVSHFNAMPSQIYISNYITSTNLDTFLDKNKYSILNTETGYYSIKNSNPNIREFIDYSSIYYSEEKRSMLQVKHTNKHSVKVISKEENVIEIETLLYDINHKKSIDLSCLKFLKSSPKTQKDSFNIGILLPSGGGLSVQFFSITSSPTPLENYSENVRNSYNKIKNSLETSEKGLYLFTGEPGTGKTNLIRKLAEEVTSKNFVFINADNAEILGNPSLIAILLKQSSTVLVIEDGESSIASRNIDHEERTKFTSNLLNITDGLMSDILKTQVIVTLNMDESNIDKAFLRPGRLKFKLKFGALEAVEANNWLKKRGVVLDKTIQKEIRLCELYNILNEYKDNKDNLENQIKLIQKESSDNKDVSQVIYEEQVNY